jgi:glutamate dehydrogenase
VDGAGQLRRMLGELLPEAMAGDIVATAERFVAEGVPQDLAHTIAKLPVLAHASDVVLVSERMGATIEEAARAFFGVFGVFDLWPIADQGRAIVLADRFDRMALDRALANLTRAQRDLTADILAAGKGPIEERIAAWRSGRLRAVERAVEAVADLTQGTLTVSRLSVAAGLLADLAREA